MWKRSKVMCKGFVFRLLVFFPLCTLLFFCFIFLIFGLCLMFYHFFLLRGLLKRMTMANSWIWSNLWSICGNRWLSVFPVSWLLAKKTCNIYLLMPTYLRIRQLLSSHPCHIWARGEHQKLHLEQMVGRKPNRL